MVYKGAVRVENSPLLPNLNIPTPHRIFIFLLFMSFVLPARQITFGARPNVAQQQPYQFQQPQQHSLALPDSYEQQSPPQPATNGLSLPGPTPYTASQPASKPPSPSAVSLPTPSNVVAGPTASTSSSTTQVPSTPVPLTLEQQHITAVEGIVPTLQNIVATVNLDCRLDLKTIALHARNAEYNPKVGIYTFL